MPSEVASRAPFAAIRYAQCWEDAAILRQGLAVQPGETVLSIASGGDNTLALLLDDPARVITIDINPAQLACLHLRIAAYRVLEYKELLELVGSSPSGRRLELYQRCRPVLEESARRFWDAHPRLIAGGIGAAGKFENYFRLFRTRILPLVHGRRTVDDLLQPRSREERQAFYESVWNSWRWRLMFRCFFSRTVLGRFGRDPAFFTYAEGDCAAHLLARTRSALVDLDPAANPYLQWILCGEHRTAWPTALEAAHFDTIRARLDRIEIHEISLEDWLATAPDSSVHRFNLSDCFEYCSPDTTLALFQEIVRVGVPGGRLVYWNLLAPRRHPPSLDAFLRQCDSLEAKLFAQDRAFFYSALVIEELTDL